MFFDDLCEEGAKFLGINRVALRMMVVKQVGIIDAALCNVPGVRLL